MIVSIALSRNEVTAVLRYVTPMRLTALWTRVRDLTRGRDRGVDAQVVLPPRVDTERRLRQPTSHVAPTALATTKFREVAVKSDPNRWNTRECGIESRLSMSPCGQGDAVARTRKLGDAVDEPSMQHVSA